MQYPPGTTSPFIGNMNRVTRDKMGRIANTPAARILRRLAADEKDNDMLLCILEAAPNPTAGVLRLISLLKLPDNRRKKITNVAYDAKVPVFEIFEAYSKGIQRLGHEEALSTISEKLLDVLHALLKQATPKEVVCPECNGERLDAKKKLCRKCGGDGIMEELPQFWCFAQKQIWKITGLDGSNHKGAGLTINQSVGVQANQLPPPTLVQPGLMEKLTTMSDEILFKAKEIKPVTVEALPAHIENPTIPQIIPAEEPGGAHPPMRLSPTQEAEFAEIVQPENHPGPSGSVGTEDPAVHRESEVSV